MFEFGLIFLSSDSHTLANALSKGLKVVFRNLELSDEITQIIYIKTV